MSICFHGFKESLASINLEQETSSKSQVKKERRDEGYRPARPRPAFRLVLLCAVVPERYFIGS